MNKLFLLGSCLFLAVGCTGDGRETITGTRADGVTVTCTPEPDDPSYTCSPEDGDDACEGYADGGTALVLWPPNHKLRTVTLADCVALSDCPNPEAAAVDGHITSITADEAVDVGKGGDGATKTYDMKIVNATSVEVRSERQGGGDGRVYRVHFSDASGVAGSCEIHVPHDQGPIGGAVDSGEAVRVTQ